MPCVHNFAIDGAAGYRRIGLERPIAVTCKTRSPSLPDVPTPDESGLPGFEATSRFGVFAPAGTPPAIVKKLNEAVVKALADPQVSDKIRQIGGEPRPETPEQFAAFIKSEGAKWADVVKASGASLDWCPWALRFIICEPKLLVPLSVVPRLDLSDSATPSR